MPPEIINFVEAIIVFGIVYNTFQINPSQKGVEGCQI